MLFDIDGTFFIHLVFFLVLMAVLHKVMFEPFLKLRDRRQEATHGRLQQSRALLESLRTRQACVERELNAHRQQLSALRQQDRAHTVDLAEQMKRLADAQAEQELASSEQQLLFEAEKVKTTLSKEIPKFSSMISERMLEKDT